MARRGGWKRLGSRGRFRYEDSRGRRITDEDALARIDSLAIPPAWREVWISPRAGAKLQATGVDKAGRRQYLYHPDFRARQEQAKFDKLVSFAEKLPDLRAAMAEHIEQEPLSFEWTAAVAVRLINLGWFRVGDERYARKFRTFGITTLRKSHVRVRGSRIAFRFRAKHRILVHTALVDSELAAAMKELLAAPGGRSLFRYRHNDELVGLSARRLNDYIREHMGEDFTAKDFRTWGGTLLAAVALAERPPAETQAEQKRAVAAVMRTVGEQL
jgi:DNA topoisomerase-1